MHHTPSLSETGKERTKIGKAISSVIAAPMEIIGEMRFQGKTRIDGQIRGNLQGESLILSETGIIEGDIILSEFICHGQVTGNITAKVVTIHSTACIKGKLIANKLTVEPGALLSGEISTADDKDDSKQLAALALDGPEPEDPAAQTDNNTADP
ncbi:MAG: hypothetical protein CSA33_08505 [Desulfobulbus propionicus]|nr:MAG: hypothetical protein CSA33_08505 [Desulfobulbus propionicus]